MISVSFVEIVYNLHFEIGPQIKFQECQTVSKDMNRVSMNSNP